MSDFDLIIIGGGIMGCGIARDAARRGLRVALFEREDFGAGTTSRSTRLIHGGLRYLQHMDFALVREDLRERERLLKNAPHLVRPLPFLLPFYRTTLARRCKLRAGLALYDLLSYDRSLPGHRSLSAAETLRVEPALNPTRLRGAALYYDAQVDAPERLCVENVVDAAAHGATIANHTEVVGPLSGDGAPTALAGGSSGANDSGRLARLHGVRVRDRLTDITREISARVVVNAAGPWMADVLCALAPAVQAPLRRTKGIHIAAPSSVQHAVVLFSETDGRLFFLIPWLGHTWVGTTDTDFSGDPADVSATAEEVQYLLAGARIAVPHGPWETIHFTQAGVRALAGVSDRDPSAVSRSPELIDHARSDSVEGLISLVGGKLTAYRGVAERAVDLACRKLAVTRGSDTATAPLPGGATDHASTDGAAPGLDAAQLAHLARIYGSRTREVLDLARRNSALAARLHPDYPDIGAQVAHSVTHEFCQTAMDFLARRSLLFFTPDQGRRAFPKVVELMRELQGWSSERCAAERAAYVAALERTAVPEEVRALAQAVDTEARSDRGDRERD